MSRLEKLENNTIKFVDYNTELASITTSGTSYTATEDCVAVCGMQINDVTAGAIVYVDGLAVASTYVYASNMSENYTSTMIYVKKGSTISTREYGIYNIKIYAMQK